VAGTVADVFLVPGVDDDAACGITHVKLIPLTEAEVRSIEAERGDSPHRVMAATSDGFSDMFYHSQRTASAIMSQVEIFRDTDFGTLILQSPGADKVNYPTKVGFLKGSQSEIFPRVGDRHFVESTRALAKQKINPVKVLIERAHEIGITLVHLHARDEETEVPIQDAEVYGRITSQRGAVLPD
jgi:hypothetical protein